MSFYLELKLFGWTLAPREVELELELSPRVRAMSFYLELKLFGWTPAPREVELELELSPRVRAMSNIPIVCLLYILSII